ADVGPLPHPCARLVNESEGGGPEPFDANVPSVVKLSQNVLCGPFGLDNMKPHIIRIMSSPRASYPATKWLMSSIDPMHVLICPPPGVTEPIAFQFAWCT